MSRFDDALDWLGHRIASRLTDESGYEPFTPSDPDTLRAALRPADVLLVEGSQKISTAIKYLTQSTWSHAAIYVGDAVPRADEGGGSVAPTAAAGADGAVGLSPLADLIEVNLGEGCVAVPLSKYASFNTRICRPIGLMAADRQRVVEHMVSSLGTKYDMRNIIDMLRYFFPTPPVPARWRRRMIALGSGEPTRAICSTLIAQAFQKVRYPILPRIEQRQVNVSSAIGEGGQRRSEIFHIRHHSLFAPCDFDLSPYFQIVKPTIERGFDYKSVRWSQADSVAPAATDARDIAPAAAEHASLRVILS